jgi:hypothetical protein
MPTASLGIYEKKKGKGEKVKQGEKHKSEISIYCGTSLRKTALSDTLSSGTFLPISTFYLSDP